MVTETNNVGNCPLLYPGCSGVSHQRGGGGEVAQLYLLLCSHEGQSAGIWHQPQGLSGWWPEFNDFFLLCLSASLFQSRGLVKNFWLWWGNMNITLKIVEASHMLCKTPYAFNWKLQVWLMWCLSTRPFTELWCLQQCTWMKMVNEKHSILQMDPSLEIYRNELIVESGRKLDKARMIRFEERTGYFASTDLGRTASHFYIRYNTIEVDIQ